MQTYKALSSADALVARTAAEALARHPDSSNIEPLLSLRAKVPADDTHLLHVVRMALRDQLAGDESWVAMMAKDPTSGEAKSVADVAPGVPSASAARYLLRYMDEGRNALSREDLVRFVHHVARYGPPGSEARLLSYVASDPPVVGRNEPASRWKVSAIEAMHQGLQARGARMSEDFRKYALGLTGRLLDSEERNEIEDGIRLASTMRLEGAVDRLTAIAAVDRPQAPAALAALSAINAAGTLPILSRSLADPAAPFPVREKAATLLAGTGKAEAQAKLLEVLPSAPERLQNVIAAGLAGRRAGAEALLDLVATGKASARLLQDGRVAGALGNSGVPNLSERIMKLLRGLPPADARSSELISKRRGGFAATVVEPSAGAKVFETHCAACHQVGGKGATIGPQLDGVGARGVDRLLEDILDPSRNVDQTFRLTTLALADGRIVSGLLVKEEGAVLVLADSQGKEVRIPGDTVVERSVAPLSPMPANFAEQIPEGDFYRLIAYLLSRGPAERK
jgi:putative heme-binding domain-containing protein